MQFLLTLLDNLAYLNPIPLPGWLVWLGLAGLLGIALFNWRKYNLEWSARATWMLGALILATPFATLFFGLEFSTGSTLPVPGLPEGPAGSNMMIFSAIPWILAGGLLGPFAAAGLGILSGLLRGVWDTHTLFTVLDLGLMAVVFAVASRQQYRTFLYRLLRQPLFSALSLTLPHAALFVLETLFTLSASASVTERLDYAFSNLGVVSLAFAGEMLVAGLAAQIIATVFRNRWGSLGMLLPSPSERSIETRFIFGAGTIISILLLTLLIGDWLVAGAAARNLLRDRLKSSAELAAQNVPFFLETGQNLARQIANDARLQDVDADIGSILREHSQAVPYFSQLVLYDMQTNTMAAYSEGSIFQITRPEEDGLHLVQKGMPNQIYTIPPAVEGKAAGVSFLAAVPRMGDRQYVLIGRTYLDTNPYTRPLVNNLNSLATVNGVGQLIVDGVVVYHSEGGQNWTPYEGEKSDQPAFFDETASRGTRQLVYYQPVAGHPWAVVLAIPAQETQQLAINIALPISLMIILLGLVALISLRVNLRSVTGSLQSLAAETKYLAIGQLDRPLSIEGEDEVSELRRAFEQMRVSLQARLQDLDRLLIASQGVASSLNRPESLQTVLEAVVANGASSARIILLRKMLPTLAETSLRFAGGPEQDMYVHLDHQLLGLAEEQERIVMATLSQSRGLVLNPNLPHPESLIALALRHENRYYGVLWAAYNKQRVFSEADLRFTSTLASQASLAVANIRILEEVVQRAQQLSILNEKLTELDKKKNEFLSIVSHELRTPLTPVQLCIQNLLAGEYGPLNDKQRSRLELALRNTREEKRLIDNLLDLARIEEGREQFKPEKGNLGKIINDVVTIFEYDAEMKEIELSNMVTISDQLEITMDIPKIKQVLTNLISNAIKFTPSEGKITITDNVYQDKVEIFVSDTGMGIPAEEQDKIFERFYQVDTSLTRKIGGTGIGLNIVKTFVELHKGSIRVESNPRSGSKFCFVLPK
jgi:signal transduction histidine kinase/HAMP domain-containing protein